MRNLIGSFSERDLQIVCVLQAAYIIKGLVSVWIGVTPGSALLVGLAVHRNRYVRRLVMIFHIKAQEEILIAVLPVFQCDRLCFPTFRNVVCLLQRCQICFPYFKRQRHVVTVPGHRKT